jgi:hypothetical protein
VGDSVTLINKVENASTSSQHFASGLSLQYQAVIAMVDSASLLKAPGDNSLQLNITGVGLNAQAKAASEGRVAGMAMINQGIDIAVSMGRSLASGLTDGDM